MPTEKIAYSQLELFSQTKEPGQAKSNFSSSFMSFIWSYEKTILLIIAFIITGIVSFALGMDRGKRIAASSPGVRFDMANAYVTPKTKAAVKPESILPQITPKAVIEKEEPAVSKIITQGYTIQLASYKSKASAQNEAEALRKKGFSPLIVNKGEYIILCVGNFSNQTTAKSLLSQLKKRYQDCYIRRL